MLQHSVCWAPLICRHWGEEQFKKRKGKKGVWENKRHRWHFHSIFFFFFFKLRGLDKGRPPLYIRGMVWFKHCPDSDTQPYSVKTLMTWKNWKHGTRPICCKILDQFKNTKEHLCKCVQFQRKFCPLRVKLHHLCACTHTKVFFFFFLKWLKASHLIL